MKILEISVSVVGIIMSLSYYPQAYTIWKNKSAVNISIPMFVIAAIGTFVWFLYGLIINDMTIILGFLFGVIGSWLVLILTLIYRVRSRNADLKNIFIQYKNKILKEIPFSVVEHVGSSAIPGIDTKGDLDIQIRVDKENFFKAVDMCDSLFTRRHEDIWTDEFALFNDPKQKIKIDIMLTVKESAYDSFYKFRDAMIQSPVLRERYVNLKKQYTDFLSDDYRKAKDVFFRELEAELGLKVRPYSNLFNKN